jgi:hypothetical protein
VREGAEACFRMVLDLDFASIIRLDTSGMTARLMSYAFHVMIFGSGPMTRSHCGDKRSGS